MAKLYRGPEPVLVIMENGLYTYHLNAGYSLQDALDLKEKTGLNNATIVAYKNAKKAVTGSTYKGCISVKSGISCKNLYCLFSGFIWQQ